MMEPLSVGILSETFVWLKRVELLVYSPFGNTIGLFLVIAGGAALARIGRPHGQRTALILRSVGYVLIAFGLTAVVTGMNHFYFDVPHTTIRIQLLDDDQLNGFDGLLMIARFLAFIALLFGAILLGGGKRLLAHEGYPLGRTDLYLGRAVCTVGYFFILCGVTLVLLVATKLSFSVHKSLPPIESCLLTSPNYWGCYLVEFHF
jgi:hypothetical protein